LNIDRIFTEKLFALAPYLESVHAVTGQEIGTLIIKKKDMSLRKIEGELNARLCQSLKPFYILM
jgi:hypothetical protein